MFLKKYLVIWYLLPTTNTKLVLKKGVLTTYFIDNEPYSSYVLGNSLGKIKKAIKERNLGETIDSSIMEIQPLKDYASLSDDELIFQLPEILHSLCYISFVALSSKKISIEDVLGDHGVIHELTHLLSNVESTNKKSLGCTRDLIKKVQSKALGLYEPV